MDFIDEQGFRANVGIILTDGGGRVLIAGRRGRGGWQFPQGGIHPEESAEAALFRELHEEVGLEQSDVEIIGSTEGWLRYRLPDRYIRREKTPLCIGQKQRWFLLHMTSAVERVHPQRPVVQTQYLTQRLHPSALAASDVATRRAAGAGRCRGTRTGRARAAHARTRDA